MDLKTQIAETKLRIEFVESNVEKLTRENPNHPAAEGLKDELQNAKTYLMILELCAE